MPITNAIIHHLQNSTESKSELNLSEQELAVEEAAEGLYAEQKRSFLSRITREHGTFNTEESPSLLQFELEAFLAEKCNFYEMTSALMKRLQKGVDEKHIEMDLHFSFYMEQSENSHNFYIFVTRQKVSVWINPDMKIASSYATDTGASLFGIKVDLQEWREEQNYVYLSLLPPKGDKALQELFTELTGFANGLNKEDDTQMFLKGVDEFSKNVPEEKVNDFREQVIDYCLTQEERDEPVNYRELSMTLDGVDGDAFYKSMADFNPENSEEVMMDRRKLQRYVKFAGREKDLAISFSSFQLNHKVHYQADKDTLTITGLPSALRKQLLTHIEEG